MARFVTLHSDDLGAVSVNADAVLFVQDVVDDDDMATGDALLVFNTHPDGENEVGYTGLAVDGDRETVVEQLAPVRLVD